MQIYSVQNQIPEILDSKIRLSLSIPRKFKPRNSIEWKFIQEVIDKKSEMFPKVPLLVLLFEASKRVKFMKIYIYFKKKNKIWL